MGRRSEVSMLVRGIEASRAARERMKVMLLTLSGDWTVRDGYERLGMGRTRFQDLRRKMLEAALRALEGGIAGRPRRRVGGESKQLRALRQEVAMLRRVLKFTTTEVRIFDCGLGGVPRVREAMRVARSSGWRN